MPRPLLLTADPALLDDLLRLAAAADAEPDVYDAAALAAPAWRDAPVVVLGADRAEDVLASGLPRRPGLLLVGPDRDDPAVWRQAVTLGAEHVLFLPDAEPWLLDRLADAVADPSTRGRVVAVVGARGGAGATSFAVALALAAARAGRRTMLVDADPYGGGIDLALGAEDIDGARWDAFTGDPHALPVTAFPSVLPRSGEVTVLAWPRCAAPAIPRLGVEMVLTVARRTAELVVVDVARSFDDASQVALAMADVVLMVCPAELRACASGGRIADTVRLFTDDVRVVVRGPAPTGIPPHLVAETLALPLAGSVTEEPGIDVELDEGRPPGRDGSGPLAEFCDTFVKGLLR